MHGTPAAGAPWLAATAWGLGGVGVCAFLAGYEPSLLEEGLLLHVASRMAEGEQLYRDVTSFTGPLPFEGLALLFRGLGEEIAVARGAVALLCGLAAAATVDLARRAGAGPWVHPVGAAMAVAPLLLFPLLALYFHTALAFHTALLAAAAAARGLRSSGWAVAAGALVAGVALCKQSVGLVLAAGLLPAIARGAPRDAALRRAGAFVLGGGAAAAATLGWYALHGALPDLVRALLLPLDFDASFESAYANLWPPGRFTPEVAASRHLYLPSLWSSLRGPDVLPSPSLVLLTQALFALPAAALAVTVGGALRRRRPVALWIHTAAAAALAANLWPRADWGHLVFVLPPALVQILLFAPRAPRGLAAGGAALLAVGLVGGGLAAARTIEAAAGPPVLGPRVPLRPVNAHLRGAEPRRTVAFLREHLAPGESLFVPRAEPLLYFATGAPNPTPYAGVIPARREEQERTILAALADVRWVAMSDVDQPLYTFYRDELPAVQRYLERHYRVRPLGRVPGWLTLLERREDRGPTVVDLFDERAGGARWVRGADGLPGPAPAQPKLETRLNRRPLALALGPRGGGIDFRLDVPPGAVFQASVGLRALRGVSDTYHHARGVELRVVAGRGERLRVLRSVRVLAGAHRGLRWTPLAVDLAGLAGPDLHIRLSVASEEPIPPGRWAFWGSPRIAIPPGTAARAAPSGRGASPGG